LEKTSNVSARRWPKIEKIRTVVVNPPDQVNVMTLLGPQADI
jgi:hypothetical protein